MLNFMQNWILLIVGIIFLFWLFSLFSSWKELSGKYKTEQCSPGTFLINQVGSFRRNKTSISSIRGLYIGVSDEGLYLSVPFLDVILPSLLIPWDKITYRKVIENFREEYLIFYFGNPQITSLKLTSSVVEKLEEDYGEPILKKQLGDPN